MGHLKVKNVLYHVSHFFLLSPFPPALLPSELDQLVQLLSSLGLTSMDPVNVLVLAEAGSRMYGLSTPTSDTDYIIVYRRPTKVHVHAVDHYTADIIAYDNQPSLAIKNGISI